MLRSNFTVCECVCVLLVSCYSHLACSDSLSFFRELLSTKPKSYIEWPPDSLFKPNGLFFDLNFRHFQDLLPFQTQNSPYASFQNMCVRTCTLPCIVPTPGIPITYALILSQNHCENLTVM